MSVIVKFRKRLFANIPNELMDVYNVIDKRDQKLIFARTRFYKFQCDEDFKKYWEDNVPILREPKYIRLAKLKKLI